MNDFIQAGFTVIGAENNENKLLHYLKENYPSIIRDNEIDLQELKAFAGLPIDEKVNGYGLNFVGRNFAKAKYAQKTEKELRLNTTMSKDIDTTQNLVLKGDNLESLKILKNHYSGKIKCIYIDPPYNTTGDEFIYPDKFDKEEAEVLGLANLSESDFERMDFSFKTKKSHNGWLSFMYPRLLLARDLLSKDGVIFISIDDNEQANLKLLCDDVFGEENFVADAIWRSKDNSNNDAKGFSLDHNHTLIYSKKSDWQPALISNKTKQIHYKNPDNDPKGSYFDGNPLNSPSYRENLIYDLVSPNGNCIHPPKNGWRWSKELMQEKIASGEIRFTKDEKNIRRRTYLFDAKGLPPSSLLIDLEITGHNRQAKYELLKLIPEDTFDTPKPIKLIKYIIQLSNVNQDEIILDFFAGSGTTGHAVMQLNAEDGGNRKFILCQIDEPIKKDKPAYQFCVENNLAPVISSITIERLKRAGEKIVKEIEAENIKTGMFEEDKKQISDVGFKVFDSVEAQKLQVDETTGQISITENEIDALSRIYNMIFSIGLDEPTQVPEMVVENCIYKIGNHYYITNSNKINSNDFSNAIKNGKVFIDGWTASLNGTLQHFKEDVKIVF
jgi:adenine-specific DNA-methyltransferase